MPVYRICRGCGLEWNVSALDPGGKHYYCPRCDARRQRKGGWHGRGMDPSPSAGRSPGEGVPVPAAGAVQGGPAQRPAGKEPDPGPDPGRLLPTNPSGPPGADAGPVRVAGFGVLPDLRPGPLAGQLPGGAADLEELSPRHAALAKADL